MKYLFGFFLITTSFQAYGLSLEKKIEIAKQRCSQRSSNEPYFFMDMFQQNASLETIDALYTQTYNQTERLFNRADYDPKENVFKSYDKRVSVKFPEHFLKSVILHIENALKLNYAKYVFFPDMGHSHFLIPLEYYNANIRGQKYGPPPSALNAIMESPGLKSLYHTAEHFKFKESDKLLNDPYLKWRFYTRNPTFDALGRSELYTNLSMPGNAVSSVKGYRWYKGISISAHKSGCFPFEDTAGEIQYFDISAWDPPYDCVNNFCG